MPMTRNADGNAHDPDNEGDRPHNPQRQAAHTEHQNEADPFPERRSPATTLPSDEIARREVDLRRTSPSKPRDR